MHFLSLTRWTSSQSQSFSIAASQEAHGVFQLDVFHSGGPRSRKTAVPTATHDGDGFAVSPHRAAGMSLTWVGHCGTSIKPMEPPSTPAGPCTGTDPCTRPKRCRPVAINRFEGVAQMGERLLCKQTVAGSTRPLPPVPTPRPDGAEVVSRPVLVWECSARSTVKSRCSSVGRARALGA